ncbi:uncharacterized protein TNIN_20031, partial [Trichonephila inaurata madagascariensis]
SRNRSWLRKSLSSRNQLWSRRNLLKWMSMENSQLLGGLNTNCLL